MNKFSNCWSNTIGRGNDCNAFSNFKDCAVDLSTGSFYDLFKIAVFNAGLLNGEK